MRRTLGCESLSKNMKKKVVLIYPLECTILEIQGPCHQTEIKFFKPLPNNFKTGFDTGMGFSKL